MHSIQVKAIMGNYIKYAQLNKYAQKNFIATIGCVNCHGVFAIGTNTNICTCTCLVTAEKKCILYCFDVEHSYKSHTFLEKCMYMYGPYTRMDKEQMKEASKFKNNESASSICRLNNDESNSANSSLHLSSTYTLDDKIVDKCVAASAKSKALDTESTEMRHLKVKTTEKGGYSNLSLSGGDLLQSTNRGPEPRVGIRKESRKNARDRNHPRRIDFTPPPGKDILYGISPCLLALEEGRRQVNKVYVTPGFKTSVRPEVREIFHRIQDTSIANLIHEVHRKDLDRLSKGRPHQGISLEASRIYFETLPEESTDVEQLQEPPVYLAINQVLDPMNMGAILRSAYYLGVDKIIASRHSCCSLTPVVSKASSGVMEVMPVYATRNLLTFIQKQRDEGWDIVGSICTPKTSTHIAKVSSAASFKLCKPTLLVIGGEGSGLPDSILNACCHLLTIPAGRLLHTGIDSLNVSVAAGILLQSILLQRLPSGQL